MEPDIVFQKALENFKKDLTVEQRKEFKITTLQDVKNEVNKIQVQHGSAKKLRGMSRMSKFLEAMQQLEKVISVFLNVSEAVAFIWGPIKFFLVVASSRLEILECLLDAFTDISEAMPDLQVYGSIFKDHADVLEVLKRCYGDIIHFYHVAFGVLGRPGAFGILDWRGLFDSFWKTFRTKFSPILGSLRRHRELLERVKSTAIFGELQKACLAQVALQETIEKSNSEFKQILWGIQQKKRQILDKLGSQGQHNDKGHRRLPDQRYPTSGDWFLEEQIFLQWLDPDDLLNDLLYLNGMPGAGKTTLISRIMDSMTRDDMIPQKPLLNFYFEHGQSGKTLFTDMLRSFIEQLLQQDDEIVENIHDTVLHARSSDLGSVSWLRDAATRIILAQKRCYIVVDGLDECALNQRNSILEWLKTVLSESKAPRVVVKILVSGQRDGVIDAMLQDCACTIRLDSQAPHLRDIGNFSVSMLSQIKDRFPGLKDDKKILNRLDRSRITEASKGMFMYAKVVLENFLAQTSIYELEQEVEKEYPGGLDEAYDRVAERVLEKTSHSQKQAALQILGLVACAARPLKWREIQCYFCIDPVNGTCDSRKIKVDRPKNLCSSFVESEACKSFPDLPSEAQLIMVHNTAKSYLFRSGRLDLVQQHMEMSLFCFRYLTSSAFDTVSQDSKTVETAAVSGFYGLFDYAAAHWDHHSLQYVRQASRRKTTLSTEDGLGEPLSSSWMEFAKMFSVRQETPIKALGDSDVPLDSPESQATPPDMLDIQAESCNIQEIFRNWHSTRRSIEFENLAAALRQIMRQTDLCIPEDRGKAVYLSLNGPFRPRCSRRACVRFNTGFESEGDLLLHISQHEMAFKCPHMGCYAWRTGFRTDILLQTHLKRIHPAIGSEERLFPSKPRSQPRTLEAACRLGDIELVRSLSTKVDMLAANRALHSAARYGHLAICVYLVQQGANPYKKVYKGSFGNTISVIQMSVRLGELDLFLALRGATQEQHEIAFIEEDSALLDCILDALESPIPQFLVDMLAWNCRRAAPLTLDNILSGASFETWRQEYCCRTLSSVQRRVPIEHRYVQEGLRTFISTEFERYVKMGQPLGLCYEKVFIETDISGRSLLHRLCDSDQEHTEAVRFLLTKLRPGDIRRPDSNGDPPLFTAMKNDFRSEGTALNFQANVIRIFFAHNLDEAKKTRNAAGYGPLEFAFKHGSVETFLIVFELCGADNNAVLLPGISPVSTEPGFKHMNPAEISDDRIRSAATLTPGEMHRFLSLLTDLDIEPGVVKMLKCLLHLTRKGTSAEPINGIPTLCEILQTADTRPTDFLLSLKETDRILKKCGPELEALAPAQLRKLFFVSLEARWARYDIAKILLAQHKLELQSTTRAPGEDRPIVAELIANRRDIDPEFVSLWERYGGYKELSSKLAQNRVTQALSSNLYNLEKALAQQDHDRLRDLVDSLLHFANSEGYYEFAASLNYIRRHRCFQQQDPIDI